MIAAKKTSWRINRHGWLVDGRRVLSPNFDARPRNAVVDLIVIHNISLPPGEFGGPGIAELFTNRLDPDSHPYYKTIHELRVSAHFLIRRDGEVIQFVSCEARAWHAGESSWDGRQGCNDFSIGVELEGCDEHSFEKRQYTALAELTRAIRARYPIRGVMGHADIAPNRKTDPGPYFNWHRYLHLIGAIK